MDFLMGLSVLLLGISLILQAMTTRSQGKRIDDIETHTKEIEKKVSDADMRYAGLWDYTQKLGEEAKEFAERCDALEEQLQELPVDQIQSIYDSEKQFQDGLSAIMNYGVQNVGLNKERIRNE